MRWGTYSAMRPLTLRQRLQLLSLTAASGSLVNLELAAKTSRCLPTAELLEAAAAAGQLASCKWLRQRGCPWGQSFVVAARAGHQPVCEWLLDTGCPGSAQAVYVAARSGDVDLVKWLRLQICVDMLDLLAAAAHGCSLESLRQLHHEWLREPFGEVELHQPHQQAQQQRLMHRKELIVAAAAASPTVDWRDKVVWLNWAGYPATMLACREVAAHPDALDRLKWLRQRGYPFIEQATSTSEGLCQVAARAGNLPVLQFLISIGVPLNTKVVREAAAGGHLEVLKWLRQRGCSLAGCLGVAARGGHLPVVAWLVTMLDVEVGQVGALVTFPAAESCSINLLKWLQKRGCRLGFEHIVAAASRDGHLPVLEWALETQDRPTFELFCAAARIGSVELLQRLRERDCPMGADGEPYVLAGRNGDLATLRCLWQVGCPWSPTGDTFTRCVYDDTARTFLGCPSDYRCEADSPIFVLHWLVGKGCPVNWAAATEAAHRRGDRWVQDWLVAKATEAVAPAASAT